MANAIITDAALAKIRTAAGSARSVAITHVAIGDGAGRNYAPNAAQNALRGERARVAVTTRMQIAPAAWRITAAFAANTPAHDIREIGFFDADGDLVAIFAGLDMAARRAGVAEYLIEHVLDFTAAGAGSVIVSGPDDEQITYALITLAAQARQDLTQFNLIEAQRAAHGEHGAIS